MLLSIHINLPHLTLYKLFVELLSGMEQMDTNAGTQLARWHGYDRKRMEGRPGETWEESRVTGAWAGSWEGRGSRGGITGLKRWDKGLGTGTGRQSRRGCWETEDRVKHQQEKLVMAGKMAWSVNCLIQRICSGRVAGRAGYWERLDNGDEVELVGLCSDSSTAVSTHTITHKPMGERGGEPLGEWQQVRETRYHDSSRIAYSKYWCLLVDLSTIKTPYMKHL